MPKTMVPCPLGPRCSTIGHSHYPGTQALEEHTKIAQGASASSSAASAGPTSVSGTQAGRPDFGGFSTVGDFIDEVGIEQDGYNLTRKDTGKTLETAYYENAYGLYDDGSDEFLEEVLSNAHDVANQSDEDITAYADDYASSAYGDEAIQSLRDSDGVIEEAKSVIKLAHAEDDNSWPGSSIMLGMESEMDSGLDYEEAARAVAERLVMANDIRITSSDFTEDYLPDLSITRYEGEVTLESGEEGKPGWAQVTMPWGQPHFGDGEFEPDPADILAHAIGNMHSVRNESYSFNGFKEGAADDWVESVSDYGDYELTRGEERTPLSTIRESRDAIMRESTSARDEARGFFGS